MKGLYQYFSDERGDVDVSEILISLLFFAFGTVIAMIIYLGGPNGARNPGLALTVFCIGIVATIFCLKLLSDD